MKINNAFSIFVRIFCTVALLSLNLQHKPLSIAEETASSNLMDQYNLRGLFALQICGKNIADQGGVEKHGHSTGHDNTGCHACRLSGSLLPAPSADQAVARPLTILTSLYFLHAAVSGTYFLKANASPRSPPVFFVI